MQSGGRTAAVKTKVGSWVLGETTSERACVSLLVCRQNVGEKIYRDSASVVFCYGSTNLMIFVATAMSGEEKH